MNRTALQVLTILLLAATLVALPLALGHAQTRAPAQPNGRPLAANCAAPGASADPACRAGGHAVPVDATVALPGLLVPLFPFTPRPALPPAPGSDQPGGGPGVSGGGAPAGPVRALSGDAVQDEVLVTIDGDAAVVAGMAADFGLEVRSQRLSALLGVTVARLGIPDSRTVPTVLAQLQADGRMLTRAPNHIYDLQQAAGLVNYAFQRIALDRRSASGKDVRVAVIDSAADATHPALKGVIAEEFDAMPDVPVATRDHGTSVAGLIAGTGEFQGMAPGAAIYHARAFEGGRSTMDVLLAALDWAVGKDARIVNMSFVGPQNDLLRAACRLARSHGVILVAAAGNNGPKAPYGYPAAYPGVIAVTATDANDQLMQQANRGPYVYVSAPGVDMLAPVGGGADLVTGTSFAAAIVSGAIANLVHGTPSRTADWVEKALAGTAKDLGRKGRDSDFGFGLIDAKAAAAAR